jgi:hypothetical protein
MQPIILRLIEIDDDGIGPIPKIGHGVMDDIELNALDAGWYAAFAQKLNKVGDIENDSLPRCLRLGRGFGAGGRICFLSALALWCCWNWAGWWRGKGVSLGLGQKPAQPV